MALRAQRKSQAPGEARNDGGLFGIRLRHLRQQQGLTLQALAELAQLDKGFLSRVERGEKRPSIETVLRLSDALAVPVGQLFGESIADSAVQITRGNQRAVFNEEPGTYRFELLTPRGGPIEGFLFHVGADPVGTGQRHDGDELFFVIAGNVEMRTPDRTFILEAGDCACFPGHISHQMRRIGTEPAVALIAVARTTPKNATKAS
jgi:transcriptional regulator with XRE-family HTH domain